MGRSRGGLTTKIHALVDAQGRPIHLKLTEGQAHDGRSAADMFDTVQYGHILLGDRAYDSDGLREELNARGARGLHPAHADAGQYSRLQQLGLSSAQRRRAVLQ
jgi:transposase